MLRQTGDRQRGPRWIRVVTAGAAVGVAALVMAAVVLAGPDGNITALSATDAPGYGQTITISAALSASSKINNSNLSYAILAPDNFTIVATHVTTLPSFQAGDTFNDSWTTTNTSFPSAGTYTLVACWSRGNSINCQIDTKVTRFYSVPTLGVWLTLLGLALLGVFLWRRRSDFRPQPVNAQ